ncbi:MAG: SBBP repeat-containing protein, partial [Candidatus Thorarchaeota archaeon]|nr:SBBP repeat-containing protein [Candidatus Thorarchaeota archaeon]
LLYSTFVGGSFTDEGKSIAIDSSNAAFVTGITSSSDFPAVNSFDDQLSGFDCFVFKLNSAGDGLLYSTFVGGSGDDEGESITIDIFGDSYVTGSTESTDFPMENPYDDTKGANSDCFVFKLNSTGNGLIFSTYIGGDGDDYGASITIDGFENVYVTGSTTSSDFPTSSNGLNTTNNGLQDIFVLLLDPNGILQYSTYLGGSGYDQGFSIDVGDEQHIYVAGRTSSSDFPTVNAYDSSFGGVSDCFVLKIQDITPPSIIFEHIMPASPDEDDNVDVYVSLQDGSGYSIVEAKISYSIDDQVSWTNVSMSEYIFIIWEGTIPQQDWNTTVYFKVYARDIISNWAVSSTWSYYVKSNDVTAPTISTSYDPTSPNDLTDVTVTADVSDPLGVPEVVLSYSIDGQSTWDNITMTFQSGTDWAAIIPQQTAGLTVHFKVYARDHANNWGVSSVDSFVVGSTPIIGTDHSPFYPTDADTVTATASVTDSGSATISEVVLSYSTDGQSTWTNVTMAYQSGNDWTANIPQQSWQTTVNYKVYARNDLNHWIISGVTSYDVGSSDVTPPNIDHLRSP